MFRDNGERLFRNPFRQESITYPWLRLNILPGSFGFEFAAQLPDENPQVLRLVC